MTKRRHIRDSERFSIVQPKLNVCYVCGRVPVEKHEMINGTANRQKSKDYGLVVALCNYHHQEAHRNGILTMQLKHDAQKAFEKLYSREEWLEIFRKNYL